jgi:hypothetical protein
VVRATYALERSQPHRNLHSIEASIGFTPEIHHPIRAGTALNFRCKTFAPELLDQRRWQKWRDDNQSFIRFEVADPLMDFRKWLDPATEQIANIEPLESIDGRHGWALKTQSHGDSPG